MRIERYPLGVMQTNCYVIYNRQNQAAVIDPGDEGKRLLRKITESGAEIAKILLTHGHFDHVGGGGIIQEKTGCEVYIHELDNELIEGPFKHMSALSKQYVSKEFASPKATAFIKDGDTIEFGEIIIKSVHTPGHSKGSVIFLADGFMFSGDTLFRLEIGRNDLYGGSPSAQIESLRKINAVKGDYIVYPGHGEDSTLDYEKKYNPYLKAYR